MYYNGEIMSVNATFSGGGAGTGGTTPHIGDNGNWFIGETDTGMPSRGEDGITPHIGDNGNWFIGETDTGMPSRGAAGQDGSNGNDGADGISPTVVVFERDGKTYINIEDKDGIKTATVEDGTTPHIGDNGNWFIGETDTGMPSRGAAGQDGSKGDKGDKGETGAAGKTPVKGTDYWTEADKTEIVKEVSESMTYVEPQKVAFTISKSCVNSTTGKIGSTSDHYRTDYIDLAGYDTIEFHGKCANSKYALAFFDSSKAIMADVSVIGAGTTLTTHTMPIPDGAAYAIGSAYVGTDVDATEATYYVCVSASTSNPVAESIAKMKKSLYSFDGKKVMFFGDSITYDESMYVANLLERTGMVKVANFALNGARLANYSDSEMDGNPVQGDSHNNTVPNQVQKLLNSVSSYEVPDIVIVSAGTNGGTAESEYDESQYTDSAGAYVDLSAVNLTKFSGAIRWIYEKLIACYPNAKIIFATPIQAYGGDSRTFAILSTKAKCIRQNCERLSTPCIDAFRKSGIYGRYEASATNGKYLKDGLHPNAAGAVVLAKCYHRELANALID